GHDRTETRFPRTQQAEIAGSVRARLVLGSNEATLSCSAACEQQLGSLAVPSGRSSSGALSARNTRILMGARIHRTRASGCAGLPDTRTPDVESGSHCPGLADLLLSVSLSIPSTPL